MKFKNIFISLFTLLLGCSVEMDVTVHDEAKAAEHAKQFLEQMESEEGMKVQYELAHDDLKKSVVFAEFYKGISQLVNLNAGANIVVFGYETTGTEESIIVYAKSTVGKGILYYRLTYIGSKSKGYKLYNFNANGKGYEYKGNFSKYKEPINVKQV